MGLEEYKGVFIYAQQVDNELSSIAFELIGKAKELAKKYTCGAEKALTEFDDTVFLDKLTDLLLSRKK